MSRRLVVEPAQLPCPRAFKDLYARLARPNVLVHPCYPLARMIAWHEGWSPNAPRGADARSPSVKSAGFDRALQALDSGRRKDLARRVQERRAAWLAPLEAEGLARRVVLRARTDAVVWLVSPGPLELGLALHHLYGFPVLPGSSLKGLARRSAGDGAATRYGTQGSVAPVAILDGLPCEGWRIQRDVMTPHFADWYQQQPGRRPDDTDDPIPIPFLSIAAGSAFEVALLARDLEAEQSLDGVIEDLRRGLDERGLGAKTAAGYGVFAVEVLPAGRQLASVGREEAIIVPATAPVATPAPAGRSPEAIALSQAITSLKSAEVKPRLQSLAEQIQHCPVEDRAALVQHLRERLRELGFKQKEIREFSKRHPVLRFSEDQ